MYIEGVNMLWKPNPSSNSVHPSILCPSVYLSIHLSSRFTLSLSLSHSSPSQPPHSHLATHPPFLTVSLSRLPTLGVCVCVRLLGYSSVSGEVGVGRGGYWVNSSPVLRRLAHSLTAWKGLTLTVRVRGSVILSRGPLKSMGMICVSIAKNLNILFPVCRSLVLCLLWACVISDTLSIVSEAPVYNTIGTFGLFSCLSHGYKLIFHG